MENNRKLLSKIMKITEVLLLYNYKTEVLLLYKKGDKREGYTFSSSARITLNVQVSFIPYSKTVDYPPFVRQPGLTKF